jgi:FHS family L-fucose permease-like MFS transporter
VALTFLKLPAIKEEEQEAQAGEVIQYKSSVFKYVHVWLCALGIFMYMGLEIGVPSMLPYYFTEDPNVTNKILGKATDFLPLYWGGMMVGRLIGTVVLSKFKARELLTACIALGAICVGLSFVLPGIYGIYAMLAAGLFHSVMWPLIFNLGLQQLGPHTKAASGVICTGVIGAGPLTMLMGKVVDTPALGVGVAICLMFLFYAYVLWFNYLGSRIGLKKA